MDQQNYFQDSPVQAPPVKNAAFYRKKAREALKGVYWIAILALLIATVLGGYTSKGSTFSFEYNINLNENTTDEDAEQTEEELDKAKEIIAEALSGNTEPLKEYLPRIIFICVIAAFFLVFVTLFTLFVGAPIAIGYQRFNLNVIDRSNVKLGVLFSYFSRAYRKAVLVRLLYMLINLLCSLPILAATAYWFFSIVRAASTEVPEKILSAVFGGILLWTVVAIATSIISIVITYRFAFASMILAEYPELGVIDAFRNSAMLMRGKKWRLFCLDLSFIGWYLLAGCATCGIGMLFITPYSEAARAAFYDDIANRSAAREAEFPSLDPDDYVVE